MHRDDHLHRALTTLPRLEASRGFTEKVLAGLDPQPDDGKKAGRHLFWAGAVAFLALAVLTVGVWKRQQERQAARAELEAIRVEQRQLLDDLRLLEEVFQEDQPILYLAGDDEVDLVLNLARPQGDLHMRRANWTPAQPRSTQGGNDP